MIDPYKWQGWVTLQNMEDIAEAFRIRLALQFDLVQGMAFHKNACLVANDAIFTWKYEAADEGGIIITHNYGVYTIGGERSDETHGTYSIEATKNYVAFMKETIYVKPQESGCYVYIPRGENG